jgi:hypothetical protein
VDHRPLPCTATAPLPSAKEPCCSLLLASRKALERIDACAPVELPPPSSERLFRKAA